MVVAQPPRDEVVDPVTTEVPGGDTGRGVPRPELGRGQEPPVTSAGEDRDG